MITILPYFLFTLALLIAISGMIYSFIYSKPIYMGKETSARKVLFISLVYGVSGSALMFSIIMFAWLFDHSQNPTYQSLLPSCLFSFVPGIFIFFASLWRFFVTGKYRAILFNLTKKDDKKHPD